MSKDKERIAELEEALEDVRRVLERMGENSLENAEDLDLTEMYEIIEAVLPQEDESQDWIRWALW